MQPRKVVAPPILKPRKYNSVKLTKEQLAQDAKRLMKANKAAAIYATTDGNYFLKKHEAETHLRDVNANKLDGLHELVPFEEMEQESQKETQKGKEQKPEIQSGKKTGKPEAKEGAKQKPPKIDADKAAAKTTSGEAETKAGNANTGSAATENGGTATNA